MPFADSADHLDRSRALWLRGRLVLELRGSPAPIILVGRGTDEKSWRQVLAVRGQLVEAGIEPRRILPFHATRAGGDVHVAPGVTIYVAPQLLEWPTP